MSAAVAPRVVIADPLAPRGLELLREQLEVVVSTEPARLPIDLPGAHALVVRSRTQVDAALMDRGAELKLIARAGIGVDNIDVSAASRRNILVINAPLGNVQSTAEHTMALILALARRIVTADASLRSGAWRTGYHGMQLQGTRLGIIGIGKVGRKVAEMAKALGLDVVACDPYVPVEEWLALPARPVDAAELLATSDIVSLHLTLTEETRDLIGSAELAAMKPGSLLINCARGGLVDEDALAQSLQSGHLAGAALDVFQTEPPEGSPLLTAPNVILTPHVAASTREAQERVSTEIAVQVLDFFAGRSVAYPVNCTVKTED
jgi:D-3-phosphoglycerate dehydrogenase